MVEPKDGGGRKSDFALFEGRRKGRGEEERITSFAIHISLFFLSFSHFSLSSFSLGSCFFLVQAGAVKTEESETPGGWLVEKHTLTTTRDQLEGRKKASEWKEKN